MQFSVEQNFPAARRLNTKEREQHLGAPRAHQPRYADDFAGLEKEVQFVLWMRGGAERPDFQGSQRDAGNTWAGVARDAEISPHHQPHHVVVGDFLAAQFARVFAIAQHHHAVGQLLHFAEAM